MNNKREVSTHAHKHHQSIVIVIKREKISKLFLHQLINSTLCMIEAYIASSTALLRSILLMSLIRLYNVNDISESLESFFSSLSFIIEDEDEESISSLNFSKTDSIAASKLCGSVERMYSSISPCGDVGVAGAKENDLFSSSPSLLDGETAFVFALLL